MRLSMSCCSISQKGREGIRANWDNSMQSFFFAETLKYAYLLFRFGCSAVRSSWCLCADIHSSRVCCCACSPPDVLPLDKYVFNTEGAAMDAESLCLRSSLTSCACSCDDAAHPLGVLKPLA